VSRGFLWQDLESEVAAEFESVQREPSLYDLDRARIPFFIFERATALESERVAPMSNALVVRRRYARAVAVNKCTKCPESARKGKRLCPACARRAVEKTSSRRRGMKERLETDRAGITHHFSITTKCQKCADHPAPRKNCRRCRGEGVFEFKGYVIANKYPDGRLGEIFLNIGKTSSSEAWIDQWARAVSFALRYGAPVDEFFGKFVAQNFEPSGPTKNKKIPRCSSVLDYVAKWVLLTFGSPEAREWVASMAPASMEAVQS
jgi:hypothetical protein